MAEEKAFMGLSACRELPDHDCSSPLNIDKRATSSDEDTF